MRWERIGWELVGRDQHLDRIGRHLTDAGRAVVVHGSAGVGKTRLAREAIARARSRGDQGIWIAATPSLVKVPLAALADLMPPTDAPPSLGLDLLQRVRSHLEERTRTRRLVVGIDDAHLLDTGSLALLRQLLTVDRLALLLTVRDGAVTPAEITSLWKDDDALRIDLAPLSRPATQRLVEVMLGGPVEPATQSELWELCRGNALFLREVVLAALEQQRLVTAEGRWRLLSRPRASARLVDLVDSRMRELEPDGHAGTQALAILEPLGHRVLESLVGRAGLVRLEQLQLVEAQVEGRRRTVRFAHPIYGEVVRATTPHAQLLEVADELIDRMLAVGQRRRGDALASATLFRFAGRSGPPALLVRAARQALGRSALDDASELAREAVDADPGFEALLAYGEALTYLRRSDEARQVLARAAACAVDDAQVARAALVQFHGHVFTEMDAAAATRVVHVARRRVTDPDWCDQLDAALALAAMLQGDLGEAFEAGRGVLQRPDPDPRTLLGVLIAGTLAQTLLGDVADALRDIERARPLLRDLRDALPLAPDQLGITEVMAHWHDARLDQATSAARLRHEEAVAGGANERIGAWAATVSMVLAEAGRVDDAHRFGEEAAARLAVADPLSLRGIVLAVSARCAVAGGRLRAAQDLLTQLRPFADRDLRTRIHADRAQVWLVASRGDITRACRMAVDRGERAIASTHVVWGAMMVHDCVRFGEPAAALAVLDALARAHDSRLLHLYADHAQALHGRDVDALGDVGRGFHSAGMDLYAAEALAQAATILQQRGHGQHSRRLASSAAALVRSLPRLRSPVLVRTDDPLTPREREVALMASSGMPSREIAERLTLSVRTVDNYLGAVYRKTGIRGRHQLSAMFIGAQAETSPGGIEQ